MNKSKTIITYGTFDLFHIGHLRLLQKLKSFGGKLIVAVSTDEFNNMKGKKTIIPYEQRKEIVENIKCVDTVIQENSWDQKVKDITRYNIDIFGIGNDWQGKFDYLREHCKVIYLEKTGGISSTQLRRALDSFSVSKEDILKAFEILEQLKEDLK